MYICVYIDGIPHDGIAEIDTALFAIMTSSAIIGIIYALICMVFNLIFFKKK